MLDVRTPFYIVYLDGRVIVAQLADAYIQSKEIVLRYRTVDGDTEKLVEVADPTWTRELTHPIKSQTAPQAKENEPQQS